jgi:hypothetical protein
VGGGDAKGQGHGLIGFQALLELALAESRKEPGHQCSGAFAQRAGGPSAGFPFDDAPRRIKRLGRDAGRLQGLGIDPYGVPVLRGQDDRDIPDHGIQQRPVGAGLGKKGVAPARAADGGGAGMGLGESADGLLIGFNRGQSLKDDAEKGMRRLDGMGVAVDEPGQDRPAPRIDDSCGRPYAQRSAGRAAHVDDRPSADGHGFGSHPLGVRGIDARIREHELGGPFGPDAAGRPEEYGGRDRDQGQDGPAILRPARSRGWMHGPPPEISPAFERRIVFIPRQPGNQRRFLP